MNQIKLIISAIEKTVSDLKFVPDPKSTPDLPIYNRGQFNISYEKEGDIVYLWFAQDRQIVRFKCHDEVEAKIYTNRIRNFYQTKTA